jgi:hypothetical protein
VADSDPATSTDEGSAGAPITGDQKGGHRRRGRRWPWITGTVVAAVIIAAVGDTVLRDEELDDVLDLIEESEDIQTAANERLDEIADEIDTAEGSGPARRRYADRSFEAAADLLVVIEELEDETVLPWHRSVDRARDRYLEHAGAWLDRYEASAAERDEPADTSVRIVATWELAEDALHGATSPYLGRGDNDRIDRIFAG